MLPLNELRLRYNDSSPLENHHCARQKKIRVIYIYIYWVQQYSGSYLRVVWKVEDCCGFATRNHTSWFCFKDLRIGSQQGWVQLFSGGILTFWICCHSNFRSVSDLPIWLFSPWSLGSKHSHLRQYILLSASIHTYIYIAYIHTSYTLRAYTFHMGSLFHVCFQIPQAFWD